MQAAPASRGLERLDKAAQFFSVFTETDFHQIWIDRMKRIFVIQNAIGAGFKGKKPVPAPLERLWSEPQFHEKLRQISGISPFFIDLIFLTRAPAPHPHEGVMKKKNFLLASVWCFSLAGAYCIGTSGNRNSAEGLSSGDSNERVGPSNRRNDSFAASERRNTRSAAESPGKLARLFGIYSMNGTDLQKMADQALESPIPIIRRLAFAKLLEAMTPENAVEMRALLAEGGLDSSSLNDFNYAWGALAGREAIDFAMTNEGTDIRSVKWVGNGAVLLNLMLNACEAMDANDPSQRSLLVSTATDGRSVSIQVRDNGRGITGDHEVIFQPFHTTKEQGLGMGLAICRSIITAHHGQIWAGENETCGATFHVVLPVREGLS